ncbi:hypothetical protein PS15p_203995 [Mucor circinelloides]
MRLITIAAAGLILLKPSLIHCQDSAGLMRLAANAGNFVDTGNAISTNSDVDQECLSDLPEVVMAWLQHFNAIALEGFSTGGGHAISGPLYVQGYFLAIGYSINGQSTVECGPENQDIISKTGLVVNFGTGAYVSIALNGNSFLPVSSITQILQESANCVSYQTGYFGPVSFSSMVAALSTIENALINLPTTLQIKSDGTMYDANPRTDPRFDKVKFAPCLYQSCPTGEVTDSDAGVVLFNGARWKGPTNRAYPSDSIVVFSIPVWKDFFIYLTTDNIGAGLQPCRAIFHFYPVSGNTNVPRSGVYDSNAQAELVRDSNGYMGGLTFAPKMVISDGDNGGFAGQLVGRAYQWRNPSGGTNILNYGDTGDLCQGQFVCFPPTNYTRPPITTHSVTITTTITTEATSTVLDTLTVTLPTASETTIELDSTFYVTVYQTITETTTELTPGFYNTLTEISDTITTTQTTSTLTNTHTEILLLNTIEEETTTTTEFQATVTTTTNTNVVLVPIPTTVTITEYPTIYITDYETVTVIVTETVHTGISSSSESESPSRSESSESESESESSSSEQGSKLEPSSSELESESESSSNFIDECTQIGDHKTHHHHHHHDDEEDCDDESHHHHHEDEENCEDESHHHNKDDNEWEDKEDDDEDDEEEDEDEKEKD